MHLGFGVRKVIQAFLVVALAGIGALAASQTCPVCDRKLGQQVYQVKDRLTEAQFLVCHRCVMLPTRCYLCGIPVAHDFLDLKDGRYLCARDRKEAVLDEHESLLICADVKRDLDRLFSRFWKIPSADLSVTMADRIHMEQLIQTPGFDRACPSVMGYIKSRRDQDGGWRHSIHILSSLPKARLQAVCAHEYTHALLKELIEPERRLDSDAAEGFCELVAHELLKQKKAERELRFIRANGYTRGQIDLFVEANESYGPYPILQWLRYGEDGRLNPEDLDAIRKLDPSLMPRKQPVARIPLPKPIKTPVPDELVLRGLSGIGNNRLALVNDTALAAGEIAKVRMGDGKVRVECLSIGTQSVTLKVLPDGPTQVLGLDNSKPSPDP